MELRLSSQSSWENFVNTSKRFLEDTNRTFPVVHYFTWKLEFFSNILLVVVVESLKATVEIQKCEFKSTSYMFKSTSYGFKSSSLIIT